MALLSATMAFFSFSPPSSVWDGLRCTPLIPPFSHAPFLPLSSPLLFPPGGTAIRPVCTDDLRYHQHHSKWIYSLPSLLRWPPTPACLNGDTWLSKLFSLTLINATGTMINGETWLIMYGVRDGDTQRESARLWRPQRPSKAITAWVADMKEDWLEVNVMYLPQDKHVGES